jgi:putative transposase
MPRKPIERSKENYYHITARSNNKEYFYLPIANVWEIMTQKLAKLQTLYQIKIGAFVLMNNHFHLLLLTPNEDIDKIMYVLMKELTLEIQKCTGRINRIFGGRYKGSLISNHEYLINVYKYIYRNPIAAVLSEKAENYQYSSLYYKYRPSLKAPFKIEEIIPELAFKEYENLDELQWLNQIFDSHEVKSIKTGLKKTVFAYEKDKVFNRPIEPIVRHPKITG